MEGNYLTSGDLALFSEAKSHHSNGYDGCYGDYGHRRGAYGTATTGIGLAAGLGGGALLLAIAGIWGINQASKSRLKAAENASAGNAKAIDILAQTSLVERQSRETWQNNHAPSMTQYVDVRTGAGAYWTCEQVEEATKTMSFPGGTTKWDKFVAFNLAKSDFCKKFDDAQILQIGYLLFFADEDWSARGSATKVWDYVACKNTVG